MTSQCLGHVGLGWAGPHPSLGPSGRPDLQQGRVGRGCILCLLGMCVCRAGSSQKHQRLEICAPRSTFSNAAPRPHAAQPGCGHPRRGPPGTEQGWGSAWTRGCSACPLPGEACPHCPVSLDKLQIRPRTGAPHPVSRPRPTVRTTDRSLSHWLLLVAVGLCP